MENETGRLPAALDLALLRSIQGKISWEGREAVARAIALATTERLACGFNGGGNLDRLGQLRSQGYCRAPVEIAPRACQEVEAYFRSIPCYAAHVPAKSDGVTHSVDDAAVCSNYGSYKLEQNLRAPNLIELALDPAVLDLAGGYLGCAPSLYSINTFWTFPTASAGMTHRFHRDEDDFRFVVVFIYWTDVEAGEGEFYFIEGTHDHRVVEERVRYKPWALFRNMRKKRVVNSAEELRWLNGGTGYDHDGLYQELFNSDIRRIDGKAGIATVSDTFGLHRGALPRSRRRLCTWIRYGLYSNLAYMYDQTAPVRASIFQGRVFDDPVTRHITRLVLDWDR